MVGLYGLQKLKSIFTTIGLFSQTLAKTKPMYIILKYIKPAFINKNALPSYQVRIFQCNLIYCWNSVVVNMTPVHKRINLLNAVLLNAASLIAINLIKTFVQNTLVNSISYLQCKLGNMWIFIFNLFPDAL